MNSLVSVMLGLICVLGALLIAVEGQVTSLDGLWKVSGLVDKSKSVPADPIG